MHRFIYKMGKLGIISAFALAALIMPTNPAQAIVANPSDLVISSSVSPSGIVAPGTTIIISGSVSVPAQGYTYSGENCWAITANSTTPTSCWYPGSNPSNGTGSKSASFTTGSTVGNDVYRVYLCAKNANGTIAKCGTTSSTLQVQNYALTAFTATPPTTPIGGGNIALTVTTNMNLQPTNYYMRIYQSGVSSYIAGCGTGTSCGYSGSITSTKTYTAKLENLSGSVVIDSRTVTVEVPVDASVPVIGASANPTATAASMTRINLSNYDYVDNIGVAGYNIYRCSGASCTPTVSIASAAGNTYSDTGLTSNTLYRYRVNAYDASGNTSLLSPIFSATTLTDTSVPTAGYSNNPRAIASSPNQIDLSGFVFDDNVGVTGYNIYRCSGASCTPGSTVHATSPVNSYSDTGLIANTSYSYRVRAYDAAGNLSAATATFSDTTSAKINPVITWATPANITYGTALSSTQLNATSNVAGTLSYSRAIGNVLQAGSQTITATFVPTNTATYNTVTKDVTFTVNKKSLLVTADSKTKTQGTANPTFTATYSGFVNGDTTAQLSELASMTTSANTNSPAGTYSIVPAGAVSSNYSFSYVWGNLTITAVVKTEPVISWGNPSDITYGTALSANQLSATTNVAGTFAYTPAAGTVLASGNHTLIATFTPTDTDRYLSTFKTVQIQVNKKAVTITADNKSKNQGSANPTLTVTYTGLVNSETSTGTTNTLSTTATTNSAAGTYPITVTGPSSTSNYTISYTPGVLTVNKIDPNVSWGTPPAITYGTALSSTQLSATSNVAGTFSYNPAAGTVLAAGNSTLIATFTPTNTSLYNSVFQTVQIQVNKKSLTIAADDKTKVQGTANPSFTASYGGFVNNDTSASLSTQPSFSTAATTNSAVGTYSITPSGAVSSNYSFSYIGGTLTVTAVPTLNVSLSAYPASGEVSPTAVFYTQLTAARSGTVTGSVNYKFRCDNNANTPYTNAGTDNTYICSYSTAGTQTAQVIVTQGGKTATADVTVTVTNYVPPTATVTATTPPSLTNVQAQTSVSLSGAVSGSGYTGSNCWSIVSGTTNPSACWYPNNVTLGNGTGTFTGSFTTGTTIGETIYNIYLCAYANTGGITGPCAKVKMIKIVAPEKIDPVITWSNPSAITYGTTLSGTQLNATANVAGTLSYSPAMGAVLAAGTPTLSVTFTPTNTATYNTVTRTVSITVNKKALTITADNKTKVQGSANPSLTASYNGFITGDSTAQLSELASLSTTATTNSATGSYPITASGAVSSNYSFSYVSGTLVVTPAGTLTAALTADPSTSSGAVSASAPMFTTLTATRSGTATGAISYKFKCKSTDSAWTTASSNNTNICQYTALGTYTAQVTATQGGLSSIGETTIKVVEDVVPPVVSEITAGTITTSAATITWTTNESATTQVEYGTSIAYGDRTSVQMAQSKPNADLLAYSNRTPNNPALVTLHTQALSNLLHNTTYHYRVISRDSLGNTTTSDDQTFKTGLPPPANAGETSGWAWSETIGWISFNSSNANSNGGLYSVKFTNPVDGQGKLSDYAWSSNIGWIQFSPGGRSDVVVNTKVGDENFGKVTGWARAISGESLNGGWDGWIELSGTNHLSPDAGGTDAGKQGVTYYEVTTLENNSNVTRGYLRGFAWGGDVVGWVDFAAGAGSAGGVCVVNCGATSGNTDFTLNTVRNITVDLRENPAEYSNGSVRVGSAGPYVGIITLSLAPHDGGVSGSNLPPNTTASFVGSNECILGVSTTCDIVISISRTVVAVGSNYRVKVIATDSSGLGIKETFVPIVITDSTTAGIKAGIKMWLKDPSNASNETMTSKKIKLGESAPMKWQFVGGANYSNCQGFLDGNGLSGGSDINSKDSNGYNVIPASLLTKGNHVFAMECRDPSRPLVPVRGKTYDASGAETGAVLNITVTTSSVQEI